MLRARGGGGGRSAPVPAAGACSRAGACGTGRSGATARGRRAPHEARAELAQQQLRRLGQPQPGRVAERRERALELEDLGEGGGRTRALGGGRPSRRAGDPWGPREPPVSALTTAPRARAGAHARSRAHSPRRTRRAAAAPRSCWTASWPRAPAAPRRRLCPLNDQPRRWPARAAPRGRPAARARFGTRPWRLRRSCGGLVPGGAPALAVGGPKVPVMIGPAAHGPRGAACRCRGRGAGTRTPTPTEEGGARARGGGRAAGGWAHLLVAAALTPG